MLNNNEEEIQERRRQREKARQAELRQRQEDELFQTALATLENGQSLDAALEGLGGQRTFAPDAQAENIQDLQDLLQLAATLRRLPQTVPEVDWARQLDAHLAVQAGMVSPNGRNHSHSIKPTLKPAQITKSRPQTGGERSQSIFGRLFPMLRPTYIFAAGMAVLLLFAISLAGLGLYLAGPRNASAATLMEVNGQLEALTPAGVWSALADGDRVQSGQRLRTGPASQATLVFYDGTRISMEPDSDVTLAQVDGDWGGELRVSLTQNAGHTRHNVVPLRGEHSSFTVLTPSGAASVHGTTFDVAVNSSGASRFGVETGRVLVSGEQGEAFLTAGQATAVQAGGVVEDPAYQFSLQGTLTSATGSTWIVEGVPFTVTGQTTYSGFDAGGPQPGDKVQVTGRVLAGGEWLADSVAAAVPGENPPSGPAISTFTGLLESNSGDTWQVAGWTVRVNGSTDIAGGIAAGDPVRVTFRLLEDGRWLAVRIESLVEPGDIPQVTESPDPDAQPELIFSPAELQAGVCDDETVSLAGSLANLAGNAAKGVQLTAQVVEGEQYLASWEISPQSFAEVAADGSENFTVNLILNETWKEAEEGEIKIRVFAGADNYTGLFDSRLTVTVDNNCAVTEETEEIQTESPTATVTPTVTPTPTITMTPTVTMTPTITVTTEITETVAPAAPTNCTGAQPHPTGTRLAAQYLVSYEEIMGWFCQGFGFGEIEQAYSLSWVSNNTANHKSPTEIFAMKTSGMGWGEIKQFFETHGNPKQWATPSPGSDNPAVQSTPAPDQQHGNPNKPPKPPKPDKPDEPDRPTKSPKPNKP